MILIALGSNLESPVFGTPQETLQAALSVMPSYEINIVRCSSWYRSAPVPPSDQPWFVNGVAQVETDHDPIHLLATLHEVERDFGRTRSARNESRIIDLDLLAYGEQRVSDDGGFFLPHPRIAERAFVLQPLRELAPGWRHPVTGETAGQMLERFPGGQEALRIG